MLFKSGDGFSASESHHGEPHRTTCTRNTSSVCPLVTPIEIVQIIECAAPSGEDHAKDIVPQQNGENEQDQQSVKNGSSAGSIVSLQTMIRTDSMLSHRDIVSLSTPKHLRKDLSGGEDHKHLRLNTTRANKMLRSWRLSSSGQSTSTINCVSRHHMAGTNGSLVCVRIPACDNTSLWDRRRGIDKKKRTCSMQSSPCRGSSLRGLQHPSLRPSPKPVCRQVTDFSTHTHTHSRHRRRSLQGQHSQTRTTFVKINTW